MSTISINRLSLQNSLKHVYSVIEKRNVMPILSNVKLTFYKNDLTLEATDMEINVVSKVSIDQIHETSCSFTVLGGVFYDLIKKIQSDFITLDLAKIDTDILVIKASNTYIELPCTGATEFPTYEVIRENIEIRMKRKYLFNALEQVRYAICLNESYYYLNGVYLDYAFDLEISENSKFSDSSASAVALKICLVATDAHRLAKSTVDIGGGSTSLFFVEDGKKIRCDTLPKLETSIVNNLPKIIIPRKAIYELCRLLEDLDNNEDVITLISDRHVVFMALNTTLMSRVIDAQFPNYKSVLPLNNNIKIVVNTIDLINAINIVTTVCTEKMKIVTMHLYGASLVIKVIQGALQNAMAKQELSVKYMSEAGLELADENPYTIKNDIIVMLNPRYLLDCLAAVKTPKVVFCFSDGDGSILVHQFGDQSSMHILMPIKGQEAA